MSLARVAVTALVAVNLHACAPAEKPEESGDLAVNVAAVNGIALDVQAVWVRVYGTTSRAAPFDEWFPLAYDGVAYTGSFQGIPVGSYRVHGVGFIDVGTDPAATLLPDTDPGYVAPDMENLLPDPAIFVLPNRPTVIALTLQQLAPPTTYLNAAPVIDSFTASDFIIETLPVVNPLVLSFTASDANAADLLDYLFTAEDALGNPIGGTFTPDLSGPVTRGTPVTVSYSPEATYLGPVKITLAVTDDKFARSALSITVAVVGARTTFVPTVYLNNTPDIIAIIAENSAQVAPGASLMVGVDAVDPDNDALAFAWTSDCSGIVGPVDGPTITFSSTTVGACTLTVAIDDGRGGTNQGSLTVYVSTTSGLSPPAFTDPTGVSPAGLVSSGASVEFFATAQELAGDTLRSVALTSSSWRLLDALGAAAAGTFVDVSTAGDWSRVSIVPSMVFCAAATGPVNFFAEVVATGANGTATLQIPSTVSCP